MQYDPNFEAMVARRKRILERSIAAAQPIEDWLLEHHLRRAEIADLARLEGLLAERRDSLKELLELDEELMDYLITKRGDPAEE